MQGCFFDAGLVHVHVHACLTATGLAVVYSITLLRQGST